MEEEAGVPGDASEEEALGAARENEAGVSDEALEEEAAVLGPGLQRQRIWVSR